MIIIIIIIIIVTFIIINSPSELNSYSFNGLKFYLRRGGVKKLRLLRTREVVIHLTRLIATIIIFTIIFIIL